MADETSSTPLLFSPVCTWCKYWHPEHGKHCIGAYPDDGGPTIPEEIWRGLSYHIGPYPNAERPTDHGVHFEPHPDGIALMKRENPGLAKAWQEHGEK